MGIELQLVELVEQHERAVVQGQEDDARRLQAEIDILQEELGRTTEQMAEPAPPPRFGDVGAAS